MYVIRILKFQVMSTAKINSKKMKYDIMTDDQIYLNFFLVTDNVNIWRVIWNFEIISLLQIYLDIGIISYKMFIHLRK